MNAESALDFAWHSDDHWEWSYLDLMRRIWTSGDERIDRTGVGTRSVFGTMLRCDLSEGRVPLLTTKRVFWKAAAREMLWFLSGDTNIRSLLEQGVTIWSDGTRMAGDLYVPGDLKPGEKRPAIVFCAGTAGTKKGNGALYGARFVREGFVVLAFDYRGWGESESKLMRTGPISKPDEKGEVTVKARPIRWQMSFSLIWRC